ncbi:MAG: hypothetical protein HC777_00535 [Hyphomonadaceae bacterium]|nr:hypothetical protein [Hyphomonadaceae bacterium]
MPPCWGGLVGKLSLAREKLSLAIKKFEHPETKHLVDHVRADGEQDLSIRPNALFSIGYQSQMAEQTLAQIERDMTQVRDLWQALVYPWGVATLTQDDPNFYPYHEHWHYYHKDAAYHNGTVWPWLNGIAIQQMIRFNQVDLAWRLFENMNRQALHEGAVGSLAECADALPIDGATWSRMTGTFLQAWSNAEQLRVWQECFLGFFAMSGSQIRIATFRSRLPETVKDVASRFRVADGQIDGHFHINGERRWRFTWLGKGNIFLTINALMDHEFTDMTLLDAGHTVEFDLRDGRIFSQIFDANGVMMEGSRGENVPLPNSNPDTSSDQIEWPTKAQLRALEQRIFANLDFCQPRLAPGLKSLSVRHDPPLTY